MKKIIVCLLIIALCLGAPNEQTNLDPSDEPVKFDALFMNDAWVNSKGGNYKGVGIMGNLYLMSTYNTEALGWWDDGRFNLEGIWIYGRRPSLAVGDYQYTSSIDGYDTFELYQAFYEHSFGEDSSLMLGIQDYTIEFAVVSYGLSMVNSSFFTPATITQIPYSFYPWTGLGARWYTQFDENYYVRAGVYDAKPSSQTRLRARDYGLSSEDGIYSIAETGYDIEGAEDAFHAKYAIGGWQSSGEFSDHLGNERLSNYGWYLLGEQELWREPGTIDQGLGIFAQHGYAQRDRNFNPWYYGAGIHYRGLFPERDADILVLAYNLAQISSRVRGFDPGHESNEQVWEFSYRMQVTPYLTLTPDIQFVRNPGGRKDLDDALIFYIRSELKL